MIQVSDKRLAILFEVTKEGTNPVEITCRADYEVSCGDCGQSTQRSKEGIMLTQAQKSGIRSLAQLIVAQL